MRVLVTEDECLIRMLVCDILEGAGHRCTEAAHASEALALLASDTAQPELLVTDYNLGSGLNGQELAAEVARRVPGLAVVFITGNPEAFAGYSLQPWQRLVPKPFLPADLAAAVESLVAGGWIQSPEPCGALPDQVSEEGARARAGCRQKELPSSLRAAPVGKLQALPMLPSCHVTGSSLSLRSATKPMTRVTDPRRAHPWARPSVACASLPAVLPLPQQARRQIIEGRSLVGLHIDDTTMEAAEL